ncbi:PepSY domain-containing protein [Rhodobacterales bacterium HKCCE3408]|nr:PepSY domain-containing protein [Rhodobacterales bacterium HKCCE3408]
MQIKPILLAALLGSLFVADRAAAQVTAEDVAADFQAQGFDFVEIDRGPTQIKVEAVDGARTVEVIIDIATGTVLKMEEQATDDDNFGRSGVRIRDRDRDFLDADDIARGRDDDDHHMSGHDDDDDDDHGDDDDDDHDDDHDDDDDDDGDDDHGGDHD